MATTDYNKYRSLYYQRWTIKSYYQIKDQIIKNDELMYVDYTSCVSNLDEDIIFISVILPSERSTLLYDTTYASPISLTKAYKYNIYEVIPYDLNNCKILTVYFPFSKENIDIEKYRYFENIDIFRNDSKAFVPSCYVTQHLNYDLTQKYRRTQIYQNKSFISEDCDYDSIDLDFNKIKMKCIYKQSLDYSYIQKESVLKISNEKTLKNLSFKCVKYVKQIEMNIGFWIHLILITLGIIIEIIF